MSENSKLPVPLNDTYVEPLPGRMPNGIILMTRVSPAKAVELKCLPTCVYIGLGAGFLPVGAFESVADALIALVGENYDIVWRFS